MTDLDRQSRLYAADRLLDTMDGTFRAQHIKQAYMDGYNAAMKELLDSMSLNPIAQQEVQHVPVTQTLQKSRL